MRRSGAHFDARELLPHLVDAGDGHAAGRCNRRVWCASFGMGMAAATWLLVALLLPAAGRADEKATAESLPSVAEVAAAIEVAHQKLMRYPGGIKIEYALGVDQPPERPEFVYHDGLTGYFAWHWPMFRCYVKGKVSGVQELGKDGKMHATARDRWQDADFDFRQGVGTTLLENGRLAQVSRQRQPANTDNCFPLIAQSWSEMSRFYVPNQKSTTNDYFLPDALHNAPYRVARREAVEGVSCLVLEWPGHDKIWIADQQNYVVCQREFRAKQGKHLCEKIVATDLREIGNGVWWPFRQARDQYDVRDGHFLCKLTVATTKVSRGHVAQEQVRVAVPESVERIEDFAAGKFIDKTRVKKKKQDWAAVVEQISTIGTRDPVSTNYRWSILWTLVIAVEVTVLVVILRRWRADSPRRTVR